MDELCGFVLDYVPADIRNLMWAIDLDIVTRNGVVKNELLRQLLRQLLRHGVEIL